MAQRFSTTEQSTVIWYRHRRPDRSVRRPSYSDYRLVDKTIGEETNRTCVRKSLRALIIINPERHRPVARLMNAPW